MTKYRFVHKFHKELFIFCEMSGFKVACFLTLRSALAQLSVVAAGAATLLARQRIRVAAVEAGELACATTWECMSCE
jgi:hypothetical protein